MSKRAHGRPSFRPWLAAAAMSLAAWSGCNKGSSNVDSGPGQRDRAISQPDHPASNLDHSGGSPERVSDKAKEQPFTETGHSKAGVGAEMAATRHFEKGLVAFREGRHAEALDEWSAAVELDPENKVYRSNLQRLKKRMESPP